MILPSTTVGVHKARRPCTAWINALSVFALACLSGCGTGLFGEDDVQGLTCSVGSEPPHDASSPASRAATNRAKIFLLRGLNNTYSLGLDELAGDLIDLSLDATLVEWPHWESAALLIAQAYPNWPDGTELMLIGHSYGADDAVRMARLLDERAVPVALLYLLDATDPPLIPANVACCIHLYTPSIFGDLFPDVFAGNPVVLEPLNDQTELTNILFTRQFFGDRVGCANHFSMDVNAFAHKLIIEEVLHMADPATYPAPSVVENWGSESLSPAEHGE